MITIVVIGLLVSSSISLLDAAKFRKFVCKKLITRKCFKSANNYLVKYS